MKRTQTLKRQCAVLLLGAGLVATLGGCGSTNKSAAPEISSEPQTEVAPDTSAGGSTTETTAARKASGKAGSGKVDCAALKSAQIAMTINWQIVLGFSRNPDVSGWAKVPIGTMSQFASQLETLQAALGGEADARAAIAFMQGANDIAQEGIAGDTSAGTRLAAFVGKDLTKVIMKQIPIGMAMESTGCPRK